MRERESLAGTWQRKIGGRLVDCVQVPGCYPPVGECVLERACGTAWAGRPGRYFLCTEGVMASAEFSLNGQVLGTAGPFARYCFEIPAGLLRRENVVTALVRDVSESFGPTPGRRFDGGLNREIYIERRPETFIGSAAFRAELSTDLSSARCEVKVEIDGSSYAPVGITLRHRGTGRVAAVAGGEAGETISFEMDHPLLWSPESPNLYDLSVRLSGEEPDLVEEAVGVRRIEIKGHDFYLNGRRLLLKGVCRHEFTPDYGYSPPLEEVRRELALIKHSGFNYIRLVHSPQAPEVPRIAAELGILVSEEPGTCFHDLDQPEVAAPALEALRRTVLRDRNCPSVIAWLIYNECDPNIAYARRAAEACRSLDPDRLLSFADCSGRHDEIKAMVEAADLSYYGINLYSFRTNDYEERMGLYTDRHLVFTEWGGWIGQGNPRVLGLLCETFTNHTREDASPRMAGCSFWAWADYEEKTRWGAATIEGWTVEGLVGRDGRPKADLQELSMMCFEMDHPAPVFPPKVEVLARAPGRPGRWQCIPLGRVAGDQSAAEAGIAERRSKYPHCLPVFGRLIAGGIEFDCRAPQPLLIGGGRAKAVIPVGLSVRRVAVLGQVAFKGGYPASPVHVPHRQDEEQPLPYGAPASRYEFVTDGGAVTQPLRHGRHILRANDICRWWKAAPRASETAPAVRAVLHPTFEILRFDLWEREFDQPVFLKEIRWVLEDPASIQGMLALSVELA